MADSRTRERLLDAAEAVVIGQGVARLTLDAVAASARVSKGGLLYHFASKDALVVGLVGRLTARIEQALADHIEGDPEPAGRHTRAYLALAFPASEGRDGLRDTLAAALIGALGTTPALLDPLRRQARALADGIADDGLLPEVAEIIRLASDGVLVTGAFGLAAPEGPLRARLLERLVAMTRDPASRLASTHAPRTPRALAPLAREPLALHSPRTGSGVRALVKPARQPLKPVKPRLSVAAPTKPAKPAKTARPAKPAKKPTARRGRKG